MHHPYKTHFVRRARSPLALVVQGATCPRCHGFVLYSCPPETDDQVGYDRTFCVPCDEWISEHVYAGEDYGRRPSHVEGRLVIQNPQLLD